MDIIDLMAIAFMTFATIVIVKMLFVLGNIKQEEMKGYGNELSHQLKQCTGINVHPSITDEMQMLEADRGKLATRYKVNDMNELFTSKYIERFGKSVVLMHRFRAKKFESFYDSKTASVYKGSVYKLRRKMIDEFDELSPRALVGVVKRHSGTDHKISTSAFMFLFWAKQNMICEIGYDEFMREIADKQKHQSYRNYEMEYSTWN